MSDYKLGRWDILTLCQLNFDGSYYRRTLQFKIDYSKSSTTGEWEDHPNFVKILKPIWDKFLFNDILQKQPELAPLIEKFWAESKTERYIESLAYKIFEDKILLKNVYQSILNLNSNFTNLGDRKEFIKKMIGYEPWIMNHLHEKIKTHADTALLSAYVDLLPKHVKEIKDTRENIWENLKKTKDFTESNYVQVLNSSVKTFKHDKEHYDFLKEQFSPKFEIYHKLREKFKKVEDKYFSQFKDNKEVDIFHNLQEYRYIFCIKDSTIIDYFGVNKNAAVFVQRQLHDCIKEYLNRHVGADLYYTYSGKGFEINTGNFDNKSKIEFHMERLKPCIRDILSSLDESTKNGSNKESIAEIFKAVTLKFELEDSLGNKELFKPKKAKI